MTMSVIQANYKNYYGVLSSQHSRLTLFQSDSWYRRNTHQHQKVSISCQYQKKDPNNNSDTGQGLCLILSYQYANDWRDYANTNDQPLIGNNERNNIRKSILPYKEFMELK